jgi:molybdopterin converting factor small subunit
MSVQVKLYGTLPDVYPGDYPEGGLFVSTGNQITVAELVDLLRIPRDRVSLVSINGRLSKAEDRVPDGAVVKFFQPLHGG